MTGFAEGLAFGLVFGLIVGGLLGAVWVHMLHEKRIRAQHHLRDLLRQRQP